MSFISWLSNAIGGGIVRVTRPALSTWNGGCPPLLYGINKRRRKKKKYEIFG